MKSLISWGGSVTSSLGGSQSSIVDGSASLGAWQLGGRLMR